MLLRDIINAQNVCFASPAGNGRRVKTPHKAVAVIRLEKRAKCHWETGKARGLKRYAVWAISQNTCLPVCRFARRVQLCGSRSHGYGGFRFSEQKLRPFSFAMTLPSAMHADGFCFQLRLTLIRNKCCLKNRSRRKRKIAKNRRTKRRHK